MFLFSEFMIIRLMDRPSNLMKLSSRVKPSNLMKPGSRTKLSPATHRGIFLIACACLVAGLFIAVSAADRDRAEQLAYYSQYEAADELFGNDEYKDAYEAFDKLAAVYDSAYILELKMSVCALYLGMWPEAVEHSRKSLEMYPRLALDEDFMNSLSYSLRKMGDDAAAAEIDDYYNNFAKYQKKY